MTDDEEPPSLGKPVTSTPVDSALGSGSAPPARAFSHGGGNDNHSGATPPSDDLNKRWKQYEQEMGARRNMSSLSQTDTTNDNKGENALIGTSYDGASESESPPGYKNYKLYETPEKPPRGMIGGSMSQTGAYSFAKSSSYDTNDLIRKYAGVTGIPPTIASAGSPGLPRPSSFRRSSSTTPQSTASALVREEAMQVLDLVDEHLNTPFHVRRTESGGFRAAAASLNGGTGARAISSPYSVSRTESGAVVVEHEGTEDEQGAVEPYYVKRTASGTISAGHGPRRTPAALSGLSLSDSATNNSRTQWRSGRYSFSDPKFRDDDFLAEDEDEIIGPAGNFDENDPNVEVYPGSGTYRDNPEISFDGDFPRGSSTWSSRYSDNPHKTKRMLDDWNQGNYGNRERQSARNMFISTANNMKEAASNVGGTVAAQSTRVFGAGFSFRQAHTFGSQKDGTNLRSLWNDDDQYEIDSIHGTRVHKTWQQVMLSKKRRRRIGCLLLCLITAVIVISVSVTSTSDQREAKRAARYPGSKMGVPITIYATSNTPYNQDQEKQLVGDLATVPNDGKFIVHLGNVQDASVSMCPPSRNYEVASIFRNSPIPVIAVPGENDWVNCPKQRISLARWLDAFLTIDLQFDHTMTVKRSEFNPELFAILHDGVLFFGLHIVSGSIADPEPHQARMEDMKRFFLEMLELNQAQFRAIVMLGNARPGPQHKAFFDGVADVLSRIRAPVAYVHADSGVAVTEYTPIPDIPFIHGIQVPSGGNHKPLKISVGFGGQPFEVE